jgi:hypothetical protein
LKKAYLILSHQHPIHLGRIINALDDGESYFLVHVDARVDIEPFKFISNRGNVFFAKERVKCFWGDFSIVEATINLIKAALEIEGIQYFILLSGQCYPLASNSEINTFLYRRKGTDFQNVSLIEKTWSNIEVKKRLEMYRFNLGPNKYDSLHIPSLLSKDIEDYSSLEKIVKLINSNITIDEKIIALRLIASPREKLNMEVMGGSQWFAYTASTIHKFINFFNSHPNFLEYFKYVHVPDEIIFPTLLAHIKSNDDSITIDRSLTYVNWAKQGVELPAILDINDFESVVKASKFYLFARKFNPELSFELLDKIDQMRTSVLISER